MRQTPSISRDNNIHSSVFKKTQKTSELFFTSVYLVRQVVICECCFTTYSFSCILEYWNFMDFREKRKFRNFPSNIMFSMCMCVCVCAWLEQKLKKSIPIPVNLISMRIFVGNSFGLFGIDQADRHSRLIPNKYHQRNWLMCQLHMKRSSMFSRWISMLPNSTVLTFSNSVLQVLFPSLLCCLSA